MRHGVTEVSVRHSGEAVGKDHFFYQTCYDEDNATLDYNCRRASPRPDLMNELPGTNDRTGNEMREKCYEQCIVDEVPLSLHFAPVDIERVRETGERVEADADRQDDLQDNGGRRYVQQTSQRTGEKVVILKEPK